MCSITLAPRGLRSNTFPFWPATPIAYILSLVTNRKPTIIRSILLVLMLVAGPLQAQTLFTCAMMDAVMEDCCCDEMDSRDALESTSEPCCEKSVELRFDPASDETSVVIKPIEVRSDVDPPPAIPLEAIVSLPVDRFVVIVPHCALRSAQDPGTDTYLVTQRLRI